jgi:hypothetical protein
MKSIDDTKKTDIKLEVYIDEIKPFTTYKDKKRNYLVIGCLFVPTDKKENLVKSLMDHRCLSNKCWNYEFEQCPNNKNCKKKYHEANRGEMHFQELKRASFSKKKISSNWLNFIIENNKSKERLVYFNILYINLDNLDQDCFGAKEMVSEKVFSRFLRTVFNYALKVFFKDYITITLKNVYQDSGFCDHYHFFKSRNLSVLEEKNPKLQISNKKVIFMDSNPRNYNAKEDIINSNLIQFIDLILGAITQCLFDGSQNKTKREKSMILFNLTKKLIMSPYSTYQHLSFFPKSKVKSQALFDTYEDSEIYRSSFYSPEKL